MKFKFKIQDYQTAAVDAVVRVFDGQPYIDRTKYQRDLGRGKQTQVMDFDEMAELQRQQEIDVEYQLSDGFANAQIELDDKELLANINKIQFESDIAPCKELFVDQGRASLDIEMETGTGKTYVYIKTIFELNKKYGWSKFIVVVPSIAIREGVKKSFEITAEHFYSGDGKAEGYKKKARFFVYNSKRLAELDNFSKSPHIQVMIINTQAFNARGEDARKIHEKQDSFNSRRPISVIAANRPIMIIDEPQKASGAATVEGLKKFNPLFTINYSATHKTTKNLVYVLDALDAYKQRLVKKIEVKGIEVKNLKGTAQYLYLQEIVLSSKKPPMARLEFEVGYSGGTKREVRILGVGDDLWVESKKMQQYDGLKISDIDARQNKIVFTNGLTVSVGELIGDNTELAMRRVQIRETIASHLEKELRLFSQGIKTLSLFFIDKVDKYREYDAQGNEINGEYGRIFEEEYDLAIKELTQKYIDLESISKTAQGIISFGKYMSYLNTIKKGETHRGYFSVDKKSGKAIDSVGKKGDISDDISAYDLIMKNKERLLSFNEPTRFIFSHSALREGWDNPNIFQICTLKNSDSTVQKHQEVGRGLRLCVNQDGDRMDESVLENSVHDINKLTVIASESYTSFVTDLQSKIKDSLYERPTKASIEYFIGKLIPQEDGSKKPVDRATATKIYRYLMLNEYVSDDGKDTLTDTYHAAKKDGTLATLPAELDPIKLSIQKMLDGIYDPKELEGMIDKPKAKLEDNPTNDNFQKKEWLELWKRINHKYSYLVNFDTQELINNAIKAIDQKLKVTELVYSVQRGLQRKDLSQEQLKRGDGFTDAKSKIGSLKISAVSSITYDLVGKLAEKTKLQRITIGAILKGIKPQTFSQYSKNAEDFINKVGLYIAEQKADAVVSQITYNKIEGSFDNNIFTASKSKIEIDRAYKADKHIQDYVITDSDTERQFVSQMDGTDSGIVVYSKLPKGFSIPTPMGDYTPDWAIAFESGKVKHIYFIAETKGSLSSLQLNQIEKAKIACAKRLYEQLSTNTIKYDVVTNYSDLMHLVK